MQLFAQVNADDDILPAWHAYYHAMGVTQFNIIMHGPAEQNATLLAMAERGQVDILHRYEGPFNDERKAQLLTQHVRAAVGQWVFVVDSDEFVELPYDTLAQTTGALDRLHADVMRAPFVQRLGEGGRLMPLEPDRDPAAVYPLCSLRLYRLLGQPDANTNKWPLIKGRPDTTLGVGNHTPPNGEPPRESCIRGVTHHYKWRARVQDRFAQRAAEDYDYSKEAKGFLSNLNAAGDHLPTEAAFPYARRTLFKRRLLVTGSLLNRIRRWLMIRRGAW